MLVDVPVQIVFDIEHAGFVQRSVAEHTVKIWKLAPHHDLVEAVVEIWAFDIVVIAQDQSLVTVEPFGCCMTIFHVDVAQMIDLVAWTHNAVPAFNHVFVHLFNTTKAIATDQCAVCVLES